MSVDRTAAARESKAVRSERLPIDDYRELVRKVMQEVLSGSNTTPRVFQNSGAEHARIVLETMMENAHESVNIHSCELGMPVWDSAWFRSVIMRSPKIGVRVIVDYNADVEDARSALSSMRDLIRNEDIVVRRAPDMKKCFHMTIVDGQHVRLEKDHATKQALVAFGARDVGDIANEAFKVVWDASSRL